MNKLTHLSLFSGIGGIDLAAHWAGFTTVGFVERDPFCQKVLTKHWPGVPIWSDVKDVTAETLATAGIRTVDLISGGFPCQPFSVAGKRRGKDDDRYLWPEMFRIIREIRPKWVIIENVRGLISLDGGMVFEELLLELEGEGYEVEAFLIPACGVNAPHQRYRIFIVAWNTNSNNLNSGEVGRISQRGNAEPARVCDDVAHSSIEGSGGLPIFKRRPRQAGPDFNWRSEDVGHSECSGCEGLNRRRAKSVFEDGCLQPAPSNGSHPDCAGCQEQYAATKPSGAGHTAGNVLHSTGEGLPDWAGGEMGQPSPLTEFERPGGREIERSFCRIFDGLSPELDEAGELITEIYPVNDRVSRLRALGNAVVPAQCYPILKCIADIERGERPCQS